MNKLVYMVLAFAFMVTPVMAGSINGANYFDQYNLLGMGTWRVLNDNTVNVDADTLQGYTPQTFLDYSDDGDAYTLINANAYTDNLQSNLENGNVIVQHSNYADYSWYSFLSGYAHQAGNADTIDGWHASDLRRYTRNQVRNERNRAINVENNLQNQIDNHESRITALENQVSINSNAISGIIDRLNKLEEDVRVLEGEVHYDSPLHSYQEFPSGCAILEFPRINNEAKAKIYKEEHEEIRADYYMNAVKEYITVGESGLTTEKCWEIPYSHAGKDYNGDGAISSNEGTVYCAYYPTIEGERNSNPCEISKVFENYIFGDKDVFVIQKESIGEPELFYISMNDFNEQALIDAYNNVPEQPLQDASEMLCRMGITSSC